MARALLTCSITAKSAKRKTSSTLLLGPHVRLRGALSRMFIVEDFIRGSLSRSMWRPGVVTALACRLRLITGEVGAVSSHDYRPLPARPPVAGARRELRTKRHIERVVRRARVMRPTRARLSVIRSSLAKTMEMGGGANPPSGRHLAKKGGLIALSVHALRSQRWQLRPLL